MFWLVYIHAISANVIITITAKGFFVPKLIICTLISIWLMLMRIFVYVQFSKDPFFDALQGQHVTDTYKWLHLAGVALITLYVIYMGMLIYSALGTIKTFQRSYRVITATTIFVMLLTCGLLGFNGQVTQRMDVRIFMSLYSLFNFYVLFMMYLYTPSTDYLDDMS